MVNFERMFNFNLSAKALMCNPQKTGDKGKAASSAKAKNKGKAGLWLKRCPRIGEWSIRLL